MVRLKATFSVLLILVLLTLSGGCSIPAGTNLAALATRAAYQASLVQNVAHTATAILPTSTPGPTPTSTPEPTATATSTTPPLVFLATATVPSEAINYPVFGPGELLIPILLYHHISDDPIFDRYAVTPKVFAEQLQWLTDNGYQTISLRELVSAIKYGKKLPPKPFVITFDDGAADIYDNAFPLLQQHGFTATAFLIAKAIGEYNSLNAAMISDLHKAGWEFGSHGVNHTDLLQSPSSAQDEICQSKDVLKQQLGIEINFFAYPYGSADKHTMGIVEECKYLAGMGLGANFALNQWNLLYLPRHEVQADYSLEQFQALVKP